MPQLTSKLRAEEPGLRHAFERELEQLAHGEQGHGAVAATVRLRALADISRRLDTSALVALSAALAP